MFPAKEKFPRLTCSSGPHSAMKFSSRTSPALLAPKRTSHHPTQIESTERLHALARYVDQDTSCGTIVCLIRNRYHVDHTFTILGCTLLPYAKYITELNLTEPQSHIVGFALWTVNRTIDLRVARLTMGDAYRLPSRVWRPYEHHPSEQRSFSTGV